MAAAEVIFKLRHLRVACLLAKNNFKRQTYEKTLEFNSNLVDCGFNLFSKENGKACTAQKNRRTRIIT